MQITAKTEDGYFISATEREIKEILKSVTGVEVEELVIGQKIPAIDYASTITKVKGLASDFYFKSLLERLNDFNNEASKLKEAVEKASEIEL